MKCRWAEVNQTTGKVPIEMILLEVGKLYIFVEYDFLTEVLLNSRPSEPYCRYTYVATIYVPEKCFRKINALDYAISKYEVSGELELINNFSLWYSEEELRLNTPITILENIEDTSLYNRKGRDIRILQTDNDNTTIGWIKYFDIPIKPNYFNKKLNVFAINSTLP